MPTQWTYMYELDIFLKLVYSVPWTCWPAAACPGVWTWARSLWSDLPFLSSIYRACRRVRRSPPRLCEPPPVLSGCPAVWRRSESSRCWGIPAHVWSSAGRWGPSVVRPYQTGLLPWQYETHPPAWWGATPRRQRGVISSVDSYFFSPWLITLH